MEKELPSTWNSTTFAMDFGPNELNPNNPADCFLNPNNWDSSMDQNDPFESALSSIVSSPTTTTAAADGFMIRELLGRLGSISNSGTGELSPQSRIAGNNINSTNTSCYSTPLNSPPKLNLSSIIESRLGKNLTLPQAGNQLSIHPGLVPLKADPGFVERAARFSCFGNRNYAQFENESDMGLRSTMPKSETGKLSRVSSSLSVKVGSQQMGGNHHQEKKSNNGASTPENMELGDSREGSSISEQNPGGEVGVKAGNESNSRKRKSVSSKVKFAKDGPSSPSPAKAKEDQDETNAKRRKEEEDADTKKPEIKDSGEDAQKQNKETSKQPEPPKDYIHVRARRGQATDSHSLAERVRREKISERMKFLQDLVPGCNKVTGKAVVLDEIINYVQSLQRQVEFLSMKLSTINPRMDVVNMDDLLSNTKDIFQCLGGGGGSTAATQAIMYPLDMSMPYLQQSGSMSNGTTDNHSFSMDHLGSSLQRNPSIHPLHSSLHGFADTMNTQMPTLWDDDLQTVVQMGFAQNQAQGFHHHGTTPTAQMKVEL